jgi:hypothetical protein
MNSNITIVTGLWDIGRQNLDGWSHRSFEKYKRNFFELLKTDINMCIWAPRELEAEIWEIRKKENTKLYFKEPSEFKQWFGFYDKVQRIRTNPTWYEQATWLKESPQANLEYYNPIVMSKMFILNDTTLMNPFNSEYFYWIDAGIASTVHPGYFNHDCVFNNLEEYSNNINKFLMISYPYIGGEEIHGFPRKDIARYCNTDYVKYVCRGGFFGGNKSDINTINSLYYGLLSNTLYENFMGTEESIFTILAHRYENLIHRFEISNDGLIWPFFEKLKNVELLVKETPKADIFNPDTKVNLYVLGFNSPTQFEAVVNSIKKSDETMFTKCRKILINNSTDQNLFQEYDRLCSLYGFEEVHRDNLGVCGGRQYVAEHFEESNADFYMFFEDDMFINDTETNGQYCINGFRKYVPNLYQVIGKIMVKEKFDFLKFSFSEFYGDNSTQWSWYNVPQHIRTKYWPHYDKLPEQGLDPNTPKTQFNNIKSVSNIPYATGEIYYSNWPQIVSRDGNKKMFLDTKWARPFEQTWMSHFYQLMKDDKLTAGVLLASPVTHNRFEFYDGSLRKES